MVVAVVFRDPLTKNDGKRQRYTQANKGVEDASDAEDRMRALWRDESSV